MNKCFSFIILLTAAIAEACSAVLTKGCYGGWCTFSQVTVGRVAGGAGTLTSTTAVGVLTRTVDTAVTCLVDLGRSCIMTQRFSNMVRPNVGRAFTRPLTQRCRAV